MVKRLFVGLLLGGILGAVVAAALVQGLHVLSFDTWALGAAGAYLTAAVTGVLTGLITGKPIWSANGKIEAGLKAFFGALIALGGMFVLRTFVHTQVDLESLKASIGPAEIGQLPAASLPIIAAVLGAFFELDNNTAAEDKEKKDDAKATGKRVRVASKDEESDEAEEEEEAPAAKKKRR